MKWNTQSSMWCVLGRQSWSCSRRSESWRTPGSRYGTAPTPRTPCCTSLEVCFSCLQWCAFCDCHLASTHSRHVAPFQWFAPLQWLCQFKFPVTFLLLITLYNYIFLILLRIDRRGGLDHARGSVNPGTEVQIRAVWVTPVKRLL